MDLRGKRVLVTGASSGIGRACVFELARRGCEVILVARSEGKLTDIASDINDGGGKAHVMPADLSTADGATELAAQVRERIGDPQVLILAAGAGRWLSVEETPPAELVEQMALPYFAAFWCAHHFLPAMIREQSGSIVNITSPAAWAPVGGGAGYSASRVAVRWLDMSLHSELRKTGVHTMLCCPGETASEYFEHNPGARERIPRVGRLYRVVRPEEVAAAIADGVERERRYVILPWLMKLTVWSARVAPWVYEWLVTYMGWRRPSLRKPTTPPEP